ncbi:hypothetical protein C3B51_11810 [Pseudoalteromonas rubra]|uniref:UspA domain-containing protein n=1 Tax=Pseudoalteromonas rubra TaxID=43658 RepID=A0A4V2E323_9GAMM|nr:universal stress protein [Pseudoalteromonas rubra]RZM80745.1 hypothetical protein C3B51_11810 [Pseudoalteromonas rubra]
MKRFNKILCVVDPETTMDTAVVQTLKLARDNQADVTFISVLKEAKHWRAFFTSKEEYASQLKELIANKRAAIEAKIKALDSNQDPAIIVCTGIGFIEIIKRAVDDQYDLVVKCAEDADWMDRMLGSEDMHLLRKCPCPVLMLKPGQLDAFGKILATVDVNDSFRELDDEQVQDKLNQAVMEYSVSLSLPELSELHVGSAWDAYAEDWLRYGTFAHQSDEQVDDYVEQGRRDCATKLARLVTKMDALFDKSAVQYLQPKLHQVKGKASKEIPLLAQKHQIDLIVMGTVGRVGIPGLIIGNTAESILEQTQCSVLAIKPKGFQTPIK